MMSKYLAYFKGDKKLWAIITILSILSLLPVYSASSNLEYVIGNSTANQHFIKHIGFIIGGFGIMLALQQVNYKYLGGFSIIFIFLFIGLLAITLAQGTNIDGANAARWLKLPFLPAFQTSVFASLVLYIYLARQLSKLKKELGTPIADLFIFVPILLVVGLIFPANGSTAIMIFLMSIIILFIGGYPVLRILTFAGIGVGVGALFILLVLNLPDVFKSNRVDTWKSRVENFIGGENVEESYQNKHAKAAIVQGGLLGKGPGKSALKQTLPQSSSDFIFAIIIEEYGYVGIFMVILIFLAILQRILFISTHIDTYFGTLLVLAVGLPIIFQAFINMMVAVNLMPVTGQTLPIMSLGGTSMWATYIAFGIIISVSREIKTNEELEKILKTQKEDEIYNIA